MGKKLITSLGICSNYSPSRIFLPGEPDDPKTTYYCLFSAALIEFLRKKEGIELEKIIFLGTNSSFSSCDKYISEEIVEKLGIEKEKIVKIEISEESFMTSDVVRPLVGILDQIRSHLQPGDRIYIDTTNSFRFVPFVFAILIFYLRSVIQRVGIKVYYGLFQKGEKTEENKTWLIDYSEIGTIIDWIYATKLFVEFGYTHQFSNLLGERLSEINNNPTRFSSDGRKPDMIRKLKDAFSKFSNSIRMGLWNLISESTIDLHRLLNQNAKKINEEVKLFIPEISPIFDNVVLKVNELCDGVDELGLQRKIILFYLESEDVGMALRLAREYLINCGIRAKYTDSKDDSYEDIRVRDEIAKDIREWSRNRKSTVQEQIDMIFDSRNDFAHFGFNKKDARKNNIVSKDRIKTFIASRTPEELVDLFKREIFIRGQRR